MANPVMRDGAPLIQAGDLALVGAAAGGYLEQAQSVINQAFCFFSLGQAGNAAVRAALHQVCPFPKDCVLDPCKFQWANGTKYRKRLIGSEYKKCLAQSETALIDPRNPPPFLDRSPEEICWKNAMVVERECDLRIDQMEPCRSLHRMNRGVQFVLDEIVDIPNRVVNALQGGILGVRGLGRGVQFVYNRIFPRI